MAAAAPKKPSASKKPKPKSFSHPPFVEMITDAIVTLKERTGSSQYAITKFIEEKHKQLPSSFRKLLLLYLKKSVAAGKLVKVKNSFKLAPTRLAPVKASTAVVSAKKVKSVKAVSKPKTASKPKPKIAAKPKVVARSKADAKPAAKAKAKAKTKTAGKPARVAKTPKKATGKPAKVAKTSKKATGKPAKVAKTSKKASPGVKVAKPIKNVKKPKSVKSPAAKKSKK